MPIRKDWEQAEKRFAIPNATYAFNYNECNIVVPYS